MGIIRYHVAWRSLLAPCAVLASVGVVVAAAWPRPWASGPTPGVHQGETIKVELSYAGLVECKGEPVPLRDVVYLSCGDANERVIVLIDATSAKKGEWVIRKITPSTPLLYAPTPTPQRRTGGGGRP